MNADYEKRLEAAVDAALKELPELQAPGSLADRVLRKTVAQVAQPWYRQPWTMWPAGLRVAALAVLLGSFGGLCFASWQLTRAAGVATAMQEVGHLFSGVTTVWNVINAVLNGLVVALKHVHPGIVLGCLAALGLAWSAFVGLGTAFFRLATARR